eukprot:11205078-Lingulodinium_polyedra.AAC.1
MGPPPRPLGANCLPGHSHSRRRQLSCGRSMGRPHGVAAHLTPRPPAGTHNGGRGQPRGSA